MFPHRTGIGFLNHLFLWPELYRSPGRVVNSCPGSKIHCCTGPLGRRAVGRASERFLMETLGRTQSERRRRIALATGLALRLFGTDRIAAPGHAAGRGWVGPDG